MAFVPIPNTVRVCIRGTLDNQEVCNVFHVKCGSAPTKADLDNIAAIFLFNWGNTILPVLSQAYRVIGIEARDMSAADQEGIFMSAATNTTGFVSGDVLPNTISYAIRLITGLTGRSRRGRFHLPGIPKSQTSGANTVAATLSAAGQEFVLDLIARLAQDSMELVVASLVSGGVPRTTGVTTPVTNAAYGQFLGSMDRRAVGRGS